MSGGFCWRAGDGWGCDGVALAAVARRWQTPCYVYSHAALQAAFAGMQAAFAASRPQICYAVKANDSLAVLSLLAGWGAGFDIVSGGELARVLAAGGAAKKTVFSGVGKSAQDIDAALQAGIAAFNVESAQELTRIEERAKLAGKTAAVAMRATFNIDGKTHRHLSTGLAGGKFGVSPQEALALARFAAKSPALRFVGFSCHIGSQVQSEGAYLQLAKAMAELAEASAAAGLPAEQINMGGGFAVADNRIAPPPPSLPKYDKALARLFAGKTLRIEPGRSLVAAAGALLTRVLYVKRAANKTVWICDAGMSDFLRPPLYGAQMPTRVATEKTENGGGEGATSGDLAGPICESADFLARDICLAAAAGDLLAIFNAGAYGLVMASNYNGRNRPPAVLCANGKARLVRRAETTQDQLAAELLPQEEAVAL